MHEQVEVQLAEQPQRVARALRSDVAVAQHHDERMQVPRRLERLDEVERLSLLTSQLLTGSHWPRSRRVPAIGTAGRAFQTRRRTGGAVASVVVGICPDGASLIRLVSMLAIEANDEWLVGWARVLRESMATQHGRSNRDTTSHLEGRARER